MNIIENKLNKIKPAYLTEFHSLIETHSQFGGGATEDKFIQGKSFSNVYEFYIYAFFIGLYNNKKEDILKDDDTKTFYEMENWKPKELVNYLFACAIGESEFDMVGIENMDEGDISKQIRILKNEIEQYANGGFRFISDLLITDPNLIEDDTFFINLLSSSDS